MCIDYFICPNTKTYEVYQNALNLSEKYPEQIVNPLPIEVVFKKDGVYGCQLLSLIPDGDLSKRVKNPFQAKCALPEQLNNQIKLLKKGI